MSRLHGQEWRIPLKSPYRKVCALMIDWEKSKEDDANERAEFQSQKEALAREFKMYRFTTVDYSIPSERSRRPYRELNKRLQEFLAHDEKGTLLIIYYGGHGENNDDKNHIWLCHNPSHRDEDDNPKVNWSSLQGLFLDECQSDILFVLDCCYSAAAAEYTHATSTVEAMVATGFEGVAPLRGEHSFTMFLVSVLRSRREEDKATFADALCRMVAAKLNRTDLKSALETSRSTPRHIPFANKVDKIIIGEVQEFDDSEPSQDILAGTPEEAASYGAGFERPTSAPVEPVAHPLQVPSHPRAESIEPATRGRPRQEAQPTEHMPRLAITASKSTSISRVTEDPSTPPAMKTPEPQVEVGGQDSDRNWLTDLYPTAPDYSAFEERLVLSKDVPCPEQYSHIRTGEIRTLHILSSRDVREPIIARLQNEEFLPQYEGSHYGNYKALSWTWGRDAWTSNIYIVDENLHTRHAISVPPTLESALRHVRHPTKKVVLWVDLICIRQDAAEERAFMISILPDIFKHASSVIVWLGDEDESSRSVVDFVGKVRDLENFDALVKNDDTPRQWDCLVEFLRRPWFSRRWVFQEIILAREAIIYCGSQTIGWTDFSDVVVLLGTCFDEVQYRLKRKEITNNLRHTFGNLVDLRALEAYSLIETARDLFRRQDDGTLISACDLETLVSFLPALQSNIPKDVIYALVGLSSDSRSSVGIDYSKSNNVVYQDFVEYCVRKSKTLDIICRPWAPNLPPSEAPAPSWVCQVNKLPFGHRRKNIYGRKSGDVLVGYPHRNYYSAARGSPATPLFGTPAPDGRLVMDGTMVASGFRVAPVRDLGFRAAAGTVHMEWIELSGWRPGAVFVPDHMWRTLVADRGPGGIPTPTWYHRACQYWLDYSEGQDITYDVIQKGQHPATALEYIQRVQSVIWDRTFIKTARLDGLDRPLYGLGPRETRAGDFICILHGCSVPVVLRKSDGADEWRLVGECFVYGLMDGEAMDIKAFTDRTQEFLLR